MTARAETSSGAARREALGTAGGGGLRGAVGAELLKLWTVRSTWACLLGAAVLQIGYSLIVGISSRPREPGGAPAAADMTAPETAVGGTLYMAQLAIVSLAVLSIAGEYATRSIGSTLLCVPVRGRLLAAKSLVVSVVLGAAGVLLALLGMGVAAVALGEAQAGADAGDVVVHAVAIGAYLALVVGMVIGVGAVMRSVAGTFAAVVVVMLVVPVGLLLTKADLLATVADFLPGPAGLHLMYGDTGPYGRGVALLVLAAWTALAQAIGYLVLRRRDA